MLSVPSSNDLVLNSLKGSLRMRPLSGVEIAQVRSKSNASTFMSKRRLLMAAKPPAHVGNKQLSRAK